MEYASVTVIIPCYQCAETIKRALDSVAKQVLQPKEVICVYDPSTDSTLDTIKTLEKHYPKNWLQVIELPKHSGPSIARNTGWNRAKGTYIAFLDADDTWHPEKLYVQYSIMKKDPNIALSGHGCSIFQGSFLHITPSPKVSNISKLKFGLSNQFATSTVMALKNIPYRFEPNKDYAEDYLLWLVTVLSGYHACNIHVPLAYRFKLPYGESGLSADLVAMDREVRQMFWKLYKDKKLSFLSAVMLSLYAKLKHYRRLLIAQLQAYR